MLDKKFYKCDPKKNTECKKTACQNECFFTTCKKYSANGKEYRINADTNQFEVVDARR